MVDGVESDRRGRISRRKHGIGRREGRMNRCEETNKRRLVMMNGRRRRRDYVGRGERLSEEDGDEV